LPKKKVVSCVSIEETHVQSHGPLGAVYPDRKWATEGDTPSFLHLFPNGLNNPDEVWQGGWGGRFNREKKAGIRGMSCMSGEDAPYDPYYMYGNTSAGASDISRWSNGYNNDFQARMDWSITSDYSEANHHPIAVVNGDVTKQVLEVSAAPGSSVDLSAAGSSDPDGDSLSYRWFYYRDPGTYNKTVRIDDRTNITPTVNVPSDADGSELHIILELRDSGDPSLYAYRRVIIHVSDNTSIEELKSDIIPKTLKLHQNYPNPFNPETAFNYELPYNSFVTFKIYDVLGQQVITLVDEKQPAGKYHLQWNASDFPSGIYFYNLDADGFTEMKKMLLIR